ncbi:Zonadhesin-like 7, partial [Homarus americanus]
MEENVQPELNFTSPRKHQGSLGKVPSHLTTPVSVRRSPLKDIANNPSELKTVKKDCKNHRAPSQFEDIHQQDEESSWRERTEVVTRIDHATYHMFAEEILKEAVSIVTKEPANVQDSEYESAEELEVDKSSMQRQLSPVLPVANSILNITSSVNCTPNRSDMVFENSLLSSFENMKIADVDEPTLEDNFHDASDSMEGIVKLSPSSLEDHGLKVAETEITKIMNTSFIIVTDGLNDSCDASNEIKEEIESYSATHETREAQSSSENSANVGEFLHDPPVTEVFVDKEEMKEIIPEVKETTPEMKEIIPEQKETIPEKKETIPEVKEIIPEVKEIIPEKKETISEVKEIIPEQKETIPEKKETIPEVKEIIPEVKETIP